MSSPDASISRRAYLIAAVALLLSIGAVTTVLLRGTSRPAIDGRSRLQRILDKNSIRAAYIIYPPTVSAGASGSEPGGFLIDVMDEIVERAKLTVTYEPTTFDDFKAGLGSRYDVVVAGVFQTIPRAKEMAFTEPIMFWAGVTAMASSDREQSFSQLSDLNDSSIRVAVTKDTAEHEFVSLHLPLAQIAPLTGEVAQTLLEVLAGRADVAFADAVTVRRFVQAQPSVSTLFGGRQFNTYATAFVVPRRDREWCEFLDAAIEVMHYDGTIARLSAKYRGDEVWTLPSEPWGN